MGNDLKGRRREHSVPGAQRLNLNAVTYWLNQSPTSIENLITWHNPTTTVTY